MSENHTPGLVKPFPASVSTGGKGKPASNHLIDQLLGNAQRRHLSLEDMQLLANEQLNEFKTALAKAHIAGCLLCETRYAVVCEQQELKNSPTDKPLPKKEPQPLFSGEWQAAHEEYQRLKPYLAEAIADAKKTKEWLEQVYEASFILKAAADSLQQDVALEIKSDNQQWQLSREHLPDNPNEKILRVACHKDWIDKFQGRLCEIIIGGQHFELGEINQRGKAEVRIATDVDFQQEIKIVIR